MAAAEDHLSANAPTTEEEWVSAAQSQKAKLEKEAEEAQKDNDAADKLFEHRIFLRSRRHDIPP